MAAVKRRVSAAAGGEARRASSGAAARLPLTISRAELLAGGSDRDFRKLVHGLFGFLARHEKLRDGHARIIGLAGVEYTAMIAIGHLSSDGDVSVKRVAEHLHCSGAFITSTVGKLVRLGLVQKRTDTRDRRRVTLSVSAKGIALLERLAPVQRRVNDIQFGALSRAEFRLLADIVDRMIESGDKAVALQNYLLSQVKR
jgi:DNA-binding MarR family transcriptional regulator